MKPNTYPELCELRRVNPIARQVSLPPPTYSRTVMNERPEKSRSMGGGFGSFNILRVRLRAHQPTNNSPGREPTNAPFTSSRHTSVGKRKQPSSRASSPGVRILQWGSRDLLPLLPLFDLFHGPEERSSAIAPFPTVHTQQQPTNTPCFVDLGPPTRLSRAPASRSVWIPFRQPRPKRESGGRRLVGDTTRDPGGVQGRVTVASRPDLLLRDRNQQDCPSPSSSGERVTRPVPFLPFSLVLGTPNPPRHPNHATALNLPRREEYAATWS